jgi:hypothetical protein
VRVTDGLLRARPSGGEAAIVSTTRLDLDRGHTLAMPTPGRGVVAMETPSRGGRAVAVAEPVRERDRGDEKPTRESVSPAPKISAPAPAKSVELPMILGLVVTLVVSGVAVWYLLLR